MVRVHWFIWNIRERTKDKMKGKGCIGVGYAISVILVFSTGEKKGCIGVGSVVVNTTVCGF